MQRITPDIKSHVDLEAEVITHLTSAGFMVSSATYHDVMPSEVVRTLSKQKNPTSLYVRTRADRIAAHPTFDVSFLVECKTNGGSYRNMAIEALPFLHHRQDAAMGVRCLYIYRDMVSGVEGGFWASSEIPVESLKIPDKWASLERLLVPHFPGVKVQRIRTANGSNDPFIVVRESNLKAVLCDWRRAVSLLYPSHRRPLPPPPPHRKP